VRVQARVSGGTDFRKAVITLSRFLPAVGSARMVGMTPVDSGVKCDRWAPLKCQFLQSIAVSDEVHAPACSLMPSTPLVATGVPKQPAVFCAL
jgi:hypothetical protein